VDALPQSCLQVPWREVAGGPWGTIKSNCTGFPTLNLMKGPCGEAEAARQGLWAVGRSDSGEIYSTS
jgi:hypothetical protein